MQFTYSETISTGDGSSSWIDASGYKSLTLQAYNLTAPSVVNLFGTNISENNNGITPDETTVALLSTGLVVVSPGVWTTGGTDLPPFKWIRYTFTSTPVGEPLTLVSTLRG